MAITRAQQARQLYQAGGGADAAKDDFKSPSSSPFSAGYSGAKSAVKTGRVSRDVDNNDGIGGNFKNNNDSDNLQKAIDIASTGSDIYRVGSAIKQGSIKPLISLDPVSLAIMAGMYLKNKSEKENNQSLLTGQQEEEEVPMMANGGIMDLEQARQGYKLGKLVKKFKRGAKKLIKSPFGKAALLYTGLGGLGNLASGASFFSNFASPTAFLNKANLANIFSGQGLGNIASRIGLGTMKSVKNPITDTVMRKFTPNMLGKILTSPGGIITATSLLPLLGLGTGDETEEEAKQLIADNTGLNFDELRPQGAMRFAADGGLMRLGYQEGGDAEPVAKKTMPLIDMDGKEKDYRETGGFVDMGRMEKADDVPARLSKNEFVFTADAVRNAGDGDIDKGAEVMYNMMKNLEAGGDVSEESQGMDGARRMFQTSQRLEEVL